MSRTPARRTLGRIAVAALLVTGVGATASSAHAAPAAPVAGRSESPLSRRLQTLADPVNRDRSRAAQNAAVGLPTSGAGSLLRQGDGRLLVDLAASAPAAVDAATAVRGVSLVATAPDGLAATVAVAPGRLEALAAVDGLRSIREIPTPEVTPSGLHGSGGTGGPVANATCPSGIVSQGDTALKAALARSTNGVDGTGIKVGVLSDSYGAYPSEVTADVKAGELPGTGNPCGHTTPVKVLSDLGPGEGSDEGRAMAQIVHDLAPGAQLLYASAFKGEIDFANQIRALRDAGATVIVDDISYYSETFFQDGPIAAAVDEVTADGVTYFSSAANSESTDDDGRSIGSYEATGGFRPTSCPAVLVADGNYTACHDFDPSGGVSNGDNVTVPPGGSITATLSWNEPINGLGTDFDVFLLDSNGKVVGVAADDNTTNGQPIEILGYNSESGSPKVVKLVVARYQSGGTPRFKVIFHRASLNAVQWNTTSGGDVVGPTVFGHNGATVAGTTAAAEWSTGEVEPFSSRGPATYCWTPYRGATPATALPSCVAGPVDFTASDGVRTTLPGDSGLNPFYGTSAAAPHAAAIAALMRQAQPCHTPAEILGTLASTADPIAATSVAAQGAGLLDAQAALAGQASCTLPGSVAAPTVVSAGAGRVTLNWAAAKAPGGDPVTGYQVQVLDQGGAVVGTRNFGTSPLTQTVTGLDAGAYRFKVAAANGAGAGPWSPRTSLTVPPFTSTTAFTKQQFVDFAGRQPTATELAEWNQALLDATASPAARISRASDFTYFGPKIDPITRQYYAYFLRGPDTSGLTYWLGQLRAGKSVGTISNSFASSQEFKNKYGSLSNRAFVELIYNNVLNRTGDTDGVNYWTGQLDQKKQSRGQVMTGFAESAENKGKRAGETGTVRIFYGMLRRAPTANEISTWKASAATSKAPLINALLVTTAYDDRTN